MSAADVVVVVEDVAVVVPVVAVVFVVVDAVDVGGVSLVVVSSSLSKVRLRSGSTSFRMSLLVSMMFMISWTMAFCKDIV